jgi:DNA anti-recombination protein RmuC
MPFDFTITPSTGLGNKKQTFKKGAGMKRLATLLLVGATIVAAQTATETKTQEMEKLTSQLQEKLALAINQAGEDAERAQKAAMEYQKQMKGKSAEEAAKIMEQRKTQTQEQLQAAIQNLEKVSEQVAAQVTQAKEQIQKRLEEKKEELKKLQKRIQTKEGTGEGSGTGAGSGK